MTDSERERFEATISAPPFECNVERYPESTNVAWPGCYIDMAVDLAWDMWQAALADHAPVPRDPTPAMCVAGFCVSEAEHDPAGVWRAMYDAAACVAMNRPEIEP